MAHRFDLLTGENAPDPALHEFSGDLLFLLRRGLGHLAFADLALDIVVDNLGEVLLKDLLHSQTALATTLVLLDQADGRDDLHVQSEGVVHYLLDGV